MAVQLLPIPALGVEVLLLDLEHRSGDGMVVVGVEALERFDDLVGLFP